MKKKKVWIGLSFLSLAATVIAFQNFSSPPSTTLTSTIQVSQFGAVGDGVSDDRNAVLNAFDVFVGQQTPSTLLFGKNKTYYLKRPAGSKPEASVVLTMQNTQNLTIDGQGATLLLDLYDSAFALTNNVNVTVKNLNIAYVSPNFTQGTVTKVTDPTYFELTLDPGYANPPDLFMDFSNSATFDNAGNFRRDVSIFIEKVETVSAGKLRVFPEIPHQSELAKLATGNRFAFAIYRKNGRAFDISKNTGVTISNIGIYGSMGGGILAEENLGELLFERIRIQPQPRTTRLLSIAADGFHFFANRGSVTIRNSLVERNLDDGVNIGSMAEVSPEIRSSRSLDLRSTSLGNKSPELKKGDTISAYNLGKGGSQYFLGRSTIASVAVIVNTRARRIELNTAILGMVALADPSNNDGGKDLEDDEATRFFVEEIANPGYKIINNEFRDKQRNGIIAKGSNGLIRKNKISNISGSGVSGTNSLNFNEGPPSYNLEVSGNTLDRIQLSGVVVGFEANLILSGQTVAVNSAIVNNIFTDIAENPVVTKNAKSVNIWGNVLPAGSANFNKNSTDLTSTSFTSLFKINGGNEIYFASGLGYCRYGSMFNLVSAWGEGYSGYLSDLNAIPNGRTFVGTCLPTEAVFAVQPNSIYGGAHDGSLCKYGSMDNLRQITGITSGSSLMQFKAVPAAPVGPNCSL